MKITTANNKYQIKMSRKEWLAIGRQSGWVKTSEDEDHGCDQCDIAMINGVRCHEPGCPNKRKEEEKARQEEYED